MSDVSLIISSISAVPPTPLKQNMFFSYRLFVVLLVTTSIILSCAAYSSLNFSITCMMEQLNNETSGNSTHLMWDQYTRSMVLLGAVLGTAIFCLPVGAALSSVGAKQMATGSMLLIFLSSILLPSLSQFGPAAVFALRFLLGIGQSFCWPFIIVVCLQWIPVSEMGRMTSIAASFQLGMMINVFVAGHLCEIDWRIIFYLWSACIAIWLILWNIFYEDSPQNCRFLSEKECSYIVKHRTVEQQRVTMKRLPFRQMLRSLPLYGVLLHTIGAFYLQGFNAIFLPTFIKSAVSLNSRQNGMLAAACHLCQYVGRIISGLITDHVSRTNIVSNTTMIKINAALCGFIPAACLIGLGYCRDSHIAVKLLLILGENLFISFYTGSLVRSISLMSPTFAGPLMALSTFVGFWATIPQTFVVGLVTAEDGIAEWTTVFWSSGAVASIGAIGFILMGSAKLQSWDPLSELFTDQFDSVKLNH